MKKVVVFVLSLFIFNFVNAESDKALLSKCVDGDTAYLSEGGITTSYKNWGTWTKIAANNGHCAIHAISVGEIKTWSYTRNDFIGFVYLPGTNTTPATPTASISFALASAESHLV